MAVEDTAREIFRVWLDEGPKSAERMIALTTAALNAEWAKGEQSGQYDFFRSAINKLRLIAIDHEKSGEAARFCATEECCDSLFTLAKVMGLDGTSWKEEEPAFWSHKLIIEQQEIYHQVTASPEHPFGVPGEDFSDGEGCWIETEPLYRRAKSVSPSPPGLLISLGDGRAVARSAEDLARAIEGDECWALLSDTGRRTATKAAAHYLDALIQQAQEKRDV